MMEWLAGAIQSCDQTYIEVQKLKKHFCFPPYVEHFLMPFFQKHIREGNEESLVILIVRGLK